MAQTQNVIRASITSPRQKSFPARADVVFYQGAIVCKRAGSKLAEIPDPLNPRADLIPLGVALYELDTTGKSDGECPIVVEAGGKRDFKTGTGDNEITADNVGETFYLYDDETLYLTDEGGTLSPGGSVMFVDEDEYNGETNVSAYFDYEDADLREQIAGVIAVAPSMQTASATLVAGTATISTGITVATDSKVIAYPTGAITGSTNFAMVRELKASRTNGAPGVGAVVIEAITNGGVLDSDAAGAVDVVILTPQS